jgi:hypothetical protein
VKNDRRTARRERRQGEDARCVLCGYAGPAPLRRIDPDALRKYIQAHHILGVKIDKDLVCQLCPNCHAEVSEDQRVQGIDLDPDPERGEFERARDTLLSLGPLMVRMGNAALDEGHRLDAYLAAQEYASVQHESRNDSPAGLRGAEGHAQEP